LISPLDLKWNQFARNNPKEIQKPDFDSNTDYQQKICKSFTVAQFFNIFSVLDKDPHFRSEKQNVEEAAPKKSHHIR